MMFSMKGILLLLLVVDAKQGFEFRSRCSMAKEKEKIRQRMITNFKSDYGNLLLSELRPRKLNVPKQIRSASFIFYDSAEAKHEKD